MTSFAVGELVWVKLGRLFWPALVRDGSECADFVDALKHQPLVIAEFFDKKLKDIYKLSDIFRYNCQQKDEFILKGLQLVRQQPTLVLTFKRHVLTAERISGGDLHVLSKVRMAALLSNALPLAAAAAAAPAAATASTGGAGGARSAKRCTTLDITHPRFLIANDYVCRVMVESSDSGAAGDATATAAGGGGDIVSAEDEYRGYTCYLCPFRCQRVNVIMYHLRAHRQSAAIQSSAARRKRGGGGGGRMGSPHVLAPGRRKRKLNADTAATTSSDGGVGGVGKNTDRPVKRGKRQLNGTQEQQQQQQPERQQMADSAADVASQSRLSMRPTLLVDWDDDDDEDEEDGEDGDDEAVRNESEEVGDAGMNHGLCNGGGSDGVGAGGGGRRRLQSHIGRLVAAASLWSDSGELVNGECGDGGEADGGGGDGAGDGASVSPNNDPECSDDDDDMDDFEHYQPNGGPARGAVRPIPPPLDAETAFARLTSSGTASSTAVSTTSSSWWSMANNNNNNNGSSSSSCGSETGSRSVSPTFANPTANDAVNNDDELQQPAGDVDNEMTGDVDELPSPSPPLPPPSHAADDADIAECHTTGSASPAAAGAAAADVVDDEGDSCVIAGEHQDDDADERLSAAVAGLIGSLDATATDTLSVPPAVSETEPASAVTSALAAADTAAGAPVSTAAATDGGAATVSATTAAGTTVTTAAAAATTVTTAAAAATTVTAAAAGTTVTTAAAAATTATTAAAAATTVTTAAAAATTVTTAAVAATTASAATATTVTTAAITTVTTAAAAVDSVPDGGTVTQLPAGLQVLSVASDSDSGGAGGGGSPLYVLVSVEQDGAVMRPLSPAASALSALQPDTLLAYELTRPDGSTGTAYLTPAQLASPSQHPHIGRLLATATSGAGAVTSTAAATGCGAAAAAGGATTGVATTGAVTSTAAAGCGGGATVNTTTIAAVADDGDCNETTTATITTATSITTTAAAVAASAESERNAAETALPQGPHQ